MGLTYWNPITKKRVDVTESTPLPVGGSVLGAAWEADPEHWFGLTGSVNERLGWIQQYTSVLSTIQQQDQSAQAAVLVYPRGFQADGTRNADGAHTEDLPNPVGLISGAYGFQVLGRNGIGVATAPTTWDVRLEGALHSNSGAYQELAALANADGHGAIKWVANKPVLYLRYRVVALTLGTATQLIIRVVGTV